MVAGQLTPPETPTQRHGRDDAKPSDAVDGSFGDTQQSIRERLEALSCAMVEDHCNTKSYDSFATTYMAPSFRAKQDGFPTASTREQHLQNLNTHFKMMPDLRLEIINVSTNFQDAGSANVFLFIRLRGLPNHFQRESVAVLRWKKQEQGWLCVKQSGMRGPSGVATV